MSTSAHLEQKVAALELENRKLSETTRRLENELAGKRNHMSDDMVDGVVATILILSAVSGAVLWLSGLATS